MSARSRRFDLGVVAAPAHHIRWRPWGRGVFVSCSTARRRGRPAVRGRHRQRMHGTAASRAHRRRRPLWLFDRGGNRGGREQRPGPRGCMPKRWSGWPGLGPLALPVSVALPADDHRAAGPAAPASLRRAADGRGAVTRPRLRLCDCARARVC
jgi:hypothetical protein